MNQKPRIAMVLAAGYGERLRPLTLTCPKPLLPVKGVPILHIILKQLKAEGFDKIVVNLHHLGRMIKESVGDGSAFGVSVRYSEEKEILGTGGGIKAAQELLGNDTFLVVNGDIIMDAPFGEIWERHVEANCAATLVVKNDPAASGYGDVKIDAEGYVRQIAGKPKCEIELEPRLFTGVQVIEPVFFSFLEKGKKVSSTGAVYPAMLERGLKIRAYEHVGYFLDIGSPDRYKIVEK